jgi:hypothetical protein
MDFIYARNDALQVNSQDGDSHLSQGAPTGSVPSCLLHPGLRSLNSNILLMAKRFQKTELSILLYKISVLSSIKDTKSRIGRY